MRKKSTTINPRDKDTLDFIKNFMLENHVTPTIREICEGLGITSTSSAYVHFKNLMNLGYIEPYGDNTIRYTVKGMKYREDKRCTKEKEQT